MSNSNALVLEILRQDGRLAMSVFEQEELSSTIRHYSQCPYPSLEIHKLCQEVTSILNKANKKGILEPDLIRDLKKIGQLLWDQLITRPVKDRLKTTQILNLTLALDEDLIHIPWELLYDGRDFLCLKFNLGRLVRTKVQINLPQYRSASGTLKMLVLANPTNDLNSAYLEGIHIKNQFDRQRNQIRIDFKSTHIDALYVKKNLRDYDILHFAGHCEYDSEEPGNSGWVLEDGRFTSRDILALGESQSLPTLVFANACYSAHVALATDSMEPDYQEKIYSLAEAFLFSGVRLYIGAIRKIEDPVSLIFAQEFYTQLIKGKSVGECMRIGRLRLVQKYGITAIPWVSYLLYGDPNFVLFRQKLRPARLKLRRNAGLYKKLLIRSLLAVSIVSICVYLYMWLPTINPNTYFLFHKSEALFSKGRNQEVITLSSRILKKEPGFLSAYPLIGNTYQRLGKDEEALKYYFAYALYSQKRHDKKNLASAYIGIGWIYQNQGDYPRAFDFYNKAVTLTKESRDKLNEAVALRKLAVWYMDKEEYDKAMELLMKSSEINRERQYIYEHRYNLACDYFDIGLVFTDKDDLSAAKEFYQKSQKLFEKLKLKNELSDYYFNLGEVYLFEKQYHKVRDCYSRGLAIDQAEGNLPSIAGDYNMLGELSLETGNLDEAERLFNAAALICKKISATLELTSVYYNLGLLYQKKGDKDKARDYFVQAQDKCRSINTPLCQKIEQELSVR